MKQIFVDIEGTITYPTGASRLQTLCEAIKLAQAIQDVAGVKVGDLVERYGAERVLSVLRSLFFLIFLDLKFFDTIDRMRRRLRAYRMLGLTAPEYLTVVAGAAPERELEMLVQEAGPINILLLTSLSSWDDGYCLKEFGIPLQDVVRSNTAKAVSVGAHGIVLPSTCLRAASDVQGFEDLIRVCPGVRSVGANAHDQKNTNTPRQAFEDGANIIVLGRQITQAQDPRAELLRVRNEECAGLIPAKT